MVGPMASRLHPPRHPVEIELDGETIVAEKGEPIAFALVAAGHVALCRSPKLHRPHGPYCLRGGCDGCLLRVNGEPNVMSCLVPCQGGEKVSSQNVLGSRRVDLMQATDWFFPRGIDHHHFLAGVPAASYVVQKIARHVAGLGKIPDEPRPIGTARRLELDVLVVGAGAAGLAVALALRASRSRPSVLVVDDGAHPGGSLLARGAPLPDLSSLDLYDRTTAAGVYEREVLLVRETEAIVVRPKLLVLATGAHDGVLPFAGNDLPGVIAARAAALLAQHDILIGERVGILGSGPYASAFLEHLGSRVKAVSVPLGASIIAEGRARLTAITVSGEGPPHAKRAHRHEVDALLVEAPGAPSFELAEQAGARVTFDAARGGYVPVADENGRALPWLWCAGELAGTGSSLSAIEEQARRVAADVERALGEGATPR
jgi:sarcosine oxidase subunit alpha